MKKLFNVLAVVAIALLYFALMMMQFSCAPRAYSETRTYLEHKPRI